MIKNEKLWLYFERAIKLYPLFKDIYKLVRDNWTG
jgi:hypothetical protein